MTGHILIGKYYYSKEEFFKNYLYLIAKGLNEIGHKKIFGYFYKVLDDIEIEWISGYLYSYYLKMKSMGISEIAIHRLLIAKIIAILSLWAGYLSKGGTFPPPRDIPPVIDTKNLIFKKNRTKPKCVVVIPTIRLRNLDSFSKFKKNLINGLISSKYIHKVILVGPLNLNNYDILPNKVEVIEIDEKKCYPSYSRNIGIEESLLLNSDVTMFIDDDIYIKNSKMVDKLILKAFDIKGIVSPLVKSMENTLFDIFHDYEGTLNGVYYKNGNLLYATTCCMAVDNNIFLSNIKFDNDFKLAAGEDIDFSIRALYSGFQILPENQITIFHDYGYSTDNILTKFINRYFRYGAGNYTVLKKHPYYFSLLSECKERPSCLDLIGKETVMDIPTEISYLISKLRNEGMMNYDSP